MSIFVERSESERTVSYLRRATEEFAVFISPILWEMLTDSPVADNRKWVDVLRNANAHISATEGSGDELAEIIAAMPNIARELVKIHLPNESFGVPVLKSCWTEVGSLYKAATAITALVNAIEPEDVAECKPILHAIDDYSRTLERLREKMAEQPYVVLANPSSHSMAGSRDNEFEW